MNDRKIFYIQQFFNEFDILLIKLRTVYGHIDGFLLSESDKTHSGIPKPPNLANGWGKRFEEFNGKVKIQFVRDTPSSYANLQNNINKDYWYNLVKDKLNRQTHWDKNIESFLRDSYEKEILLRGLAQGFNPDDNDVVIVTDLDEIIRPETIDYLKRFVRHDGGAYHLECNTYYYYYNLRKDEYWNSPFACTYKTLKENSICEMRNLMKNGITLGNAGWHFTYIGDTKTIQKKIESFCHQELNLPWVKENLRSSIKNAISSGRDLYGRPCKFWLDDMENLPEYLRTNKDKYISNFLNLDTEAQV